MGRTFGQRTVLSGSLNNGPVGTTPAGLEGTVALKENRIQLVTDTFGDIPKGNRDGLGLYMLDTRFLSQFELLVNGQTPIYLSHSADRNYIATFQFVNQALALPDGTRVPRQTVSIRRSRFVDGFALHERIGFYNCNHFPLEIEACLAFDADFADIFAVRQFAPQRRGPRGSVKFGAKRLTFSYLGRDKVSRRTVIEYDREPEPTASNAMIFRLRLEPHVPASLTLRIVPRVDEAPAAGKDHFDTALDRLAASYDAWHQECASIQTNNEQFDRDLLRQSRLDIRALLDVEDSPVIEPGSNVAPAAGIPWYAVPFGRDSLITALQTLIYNPRIAEGTLRMLARYQGTKVDVRTEEQPGKIFHELRRGELANLREIPHVPYYGTVDATPLFIVLFVETMAWLGHSTSGQALYHDLLPAVSRALEWCDRYGDEDGDGYVEYRAGQAGGVINQGWKDSFDSLQYADGSLAKLPAALVEVQGYVYNAKIGVSRLASDWGDTELATKLESEAADLKLRFNQDFWMPNESFLAQALDGDKRHIESVTSNAGQCLWSGIVEEEKAPMVARRLFADDMFSGWGIRTLSARSSNYNPMSYHNGSIWPHDNSLIAAGLRRYGFDDLASRLAGSVLAAGLRLPAKRLPELFCGFPRDMKFNSSPATYIVSCSPQAWAAASPFLFLQVLLGITPRWGETVQVNPIQSPLFYRYRIVGMRIGDKRLSLEVHASDECRIRRLEGDVAIVSTTGSVA